ncbi:helix-turn-helix domain-containing protein [Niveispirillum fermenti]|uniref:helix-turn-helix domain-containing protein n=1 Tax=Niveispirillum fermenti TaxID=1233113 RepID=UPI003A83F1DB
MTYKRIRSLERGVAILQYVNTMGEATAGKIAQEIDLPRPTVYRILDTLVESGLLYRSPSAQKVYRLTEAVGKLITGIERADPVATAAHSVLSNSSLDVSWPVFLCTYSEKGMVIRETTRGSSVFWTDLGWVGAAAPIWEVAPGWAFAAHASPELQAFLIEQGPPDVKSRLETIRQQGYALDHDATGRVSGVAVPVGKGDTLVGALATVWEVSEAPEANPVDGYLASLRSLRDQILEELASDMDYSSSLDSR